MQYSFEAGELKDHDEQPSVFTGALVDGLSSGRADRDGDGWVGIHELFSYVSEKVRKTSAHQRPQMWTFGAQGDFRLARSRVRHVVARPSNRFDRSWPTRGPQPGMGWSACSVTALVGPDLGVALTAWQACRSWSAMTITSSPTRPAALSPRQRCTSRLAALEV